MGGRIENVDAASSRVIPTVLNELGLPTWQRACAAVSLSRAIQICQPAVDLPVMVTAALMTGITT